MSIYNYVEAQNIIQEVVFAFCVHFCTLLSHNMKIFFLVSQWILDLELAWCVDSLLFLTVIKVPKIKIV